MKSRFQWLPTLPSCPNGHALLRTLSTGAESSDSREHVLTVTKVFKHNVIPTNASGRTMGINRSRTGPFRSSCLLQQHQRRQQVHANSIDEIRCTNQSRAWTKTEQLRLRTRGNKTRPTTEPDTLEESGDDSRPWRSGQGSVRQNREHCPALAE